MAAERYNCGTVKRPDFVPWEKNTVRPTAGANTRGMLVMLALIAVPRPRNRATRIAESRKDSECASGSPV